MIHIFLLDDQQGDVVIEMINSYVCLKWEEQQIDMYVQYSIIASNNVSEFGCGILHGWLVLNSKLNELLILFHWMKIAKVGFPHINWLNKRLWKTFHKIIKYNLKQALVIQCEKGDTLYLKFIFCEKFWFSWAHIDACILKLRGGGV